MKYIVQIPARLGSKRVKMKNLRLINNKPLVYYSINAAKNAKKVKEVYLNSS